MLVRVSVARAASAPGVEAADPGFELDLGFPRVRVWWSVAVWRIPKLLRQSLCVESGQCEHQKSYMETLQCLLSKKKKESAVACVRNSQIFWILNRFLGGYGNFSGINVKQFVIDGQQLSLAYLSSCILHYPLYKGKGHVWFIM